MFPSRRFGALLALLFFALLAPAQAREDRPGGYARPEMLVETDWLARHGRGARLRVIDLREAAAYARGHLPGAVSLPASRLRRADDRETYLPSPNALALWMSQAGVDSKTRVIAYDDQGGKEAARLWYVLQVHGHMRVSLLNGGWKKWLAEGRPTETETPAVPPRVFVPAAVPALTCPSSAVLARRSDTLVLDTRAPEEFAGALLSPGAARAGHIPGAVNLEWKESLTGPEETFKPAPALRALFASRGITPEREIVAHCASGGRAAHTLFVLTLLGYPHVRLYYGSFSDYAARPAAPVER